MQVWKKYKFKNITFLLLSLIAAYYFFQNENIHSLLLHLGKFGYVSAFLAGMLFVSTFTISIGAIMLLVLLEYLNPVEICIIAGMGSVVSDVMIFRYIKTAGFLKEIKAFYKYFGGNKISHLFHTKYFGWTLPVIGALLIASPLPDELGVSLMGISKMKTIQFMFIAFLLDSIGIFLVLSLSTFVKP